MRFYFFVKVYLCSKTAVSLWFFEEITEGMIDMKSNREKCEKVRSIKLQQEISFKLLMR